MRVYINGTSSKSPQVTVSTVGPSPAAIRAAGDMPAMLAWSVHAADDDLRKKLVPTTAHAMTELRDTFMDVLTKRSKQMSTFMVAVTLIEGLNDGPEQATALIELLQPLVDSGIKGLVVDLIPYNDIGQDGLKRTGKDRVTMFQRQLRDAGEKSAADPSSQQVFDEDGTLSKITQTQSPFAAIPEPLGPW